MKVVFLPLIPISLFIFFLQNDHFSYGTESPEALVHYQKGWEQILDRGEWTLAEESFRKAVQIDSGFVLAWSQVGRISKKPEERSLIFQQLSAKQGKLSGWEKKLLEVYLGSLELIDLKDRGLSITPNQISNFYKISEKNFSEFLQAYPNEQYVNSEFIEVIHGISGPQAALDTLQKQKAEGKKLNPFLISYTAQMQAEMMDFENAFQTAHDLEKMLKDLHLPIIPFTYAVIHFEKKEFESAAKMINQTLTLDGNHTLAQRLEKLEGEKTKDIEPSKP